LKFELLQEENAELQRQCAELKGKITLQGRELIRTTHRFTAKISLHIGGVSEEERWQAKERKAKEMARSWNGQKHTI